MRLGLLGDIHGNSLALSAVLKSARKLRVDALCLTGDFVGYYYEPDKVFEMLEDWVVYSVRGNHEDLFLECSKSSDAAAKYRARYGSGIDYAVRLLSYKHKEAIKNLPRTRKLELDGKTVFLAHGSPWSTDFYLYPDSDPVFWERASQCGADYIVLGHTHHRVARRVGKSLIVNPGSVGQPRDRIPGAAWAILDTDSGELEHRTEQYEIARLVERVKVVDPQKSYLWKVLTRQ